MSHVTIVRARYHSLFNFTTMKKLFGKFIFLAIFSFGASATFAHHLNGNKQFDKFNSVGDEDSSKIIPIEILDFGGEAINTKKIALWCKAKSTVSYNITVERSRNGSDFSAIGTFPNTEELERYSLVDYKPVHNTNYYRLKITDARGRVNYSKMMVLQLYQTSTLSMVSVTPNPALNDIHVNVQLKDKAYVSVRITDAAGREIVKKKMQASEGLNEFRLEGTGKMNPGNYSLQVVVNGTESLTVPLIKS